MMLKHPLFLLLAAPVALVDGSSSPSPLPNLQPNRPKQTQLTVQSTNRPALIIDPPCHSTACSTDAFTISWTMDPTESHTAFIAGITYAAGASLTERTFNPMTITDSTTVLPSNFLPALRPGDTSVIDFGLYTTDAGGKWGVWYSDIVLVAPVATPTTATQTVTETSVFTVTASASAETPVPTDTAGVDEELGPDPGVDENTDSGSGSDGLSTGAKAGIGAGVGAGALLILVAGGIWFVRRRRQMNKDWESVPVIPTGVEAQGMITKSGMVSPGTAITTPSEAEHGARYEMRA
ncbi:hypothetical protein BJX62DRAFT_240663 [Aspergillus germanicus]